MRIQHFINNQFYHHLTQLNLNLDSNLKREFAEDNNDQLLLINKYQSANNQDLSSDKKNLSPKMNALQQKQFKHL